LLAMVPRLGPGEKGGRPTGGVAVSVKFSSVVSGVSHAIW
jgi:hypothetical protein